MRLYLLRPIIPLRQKRETEEFRGNIVYKAMSGHVTSGLRSSELKTKHAGVT